MALQQSHLSTAGEGSATCATGSRQISSITLTVPFGWLPPSGMDSGYPDHNTTPARKSQLSPSEAPWWPFGFNPKYSSRTAYNEH